METQFADHPIEDYDLIAIRHAQSNFNKGYFDYRQINQLQHLNWDDCLQIEDFRDEVAYAEKHFDCSISQEGRKQCISARQNFKDLQIDIILVSPLMRALETCQQIFGDRNIPVQVHPILSQVFRFSSEISHHCKEKIEMFKKFDFSHMNDHSQLWFIEILQKQHALHCERHIQEHKPVTYFQKQQKILELIKKKVIYETPQQFRQRSWKIKSLLQEYKKKYKKIAVISHYFIVLSFIAEEYNELGQVINPPPIENASAVFANIERISKIK